MKLASAFAVFACAFFAHASTVANVLTDIAEITTGYINWNAQIVSLPSTGGTQNLAAALAIHSAVAPIVTDTNFAATNTINLTPLPVSVADGTSILHAFNNLEPIIIAALINIVAKKAAFNAISIGSLPALIKSDLNNLNTATLAFEAALIAKTPASLQASASRLTSSINSAFATAIASYSIF